MKFMLSGYALLLSIIVVSGCSAPSNMIVVDRVEAAGENEAIVNFVRPAVFYGDAIDREVWDGDKFLGTLNAGSMLQYKTTPGVHYLMLNSRGRGWALAKANLEAGQVYYLKANTPPMGDVRFGLAKPDDTRIPGWNVDLEPLAINPVKPEPPKAKKTRQKYEAKQAKRIRKMQAKLMEFKSGTAQYLEVGNFSDSSNL